MGVRGDDTTYALRARALLADTRHLRAITALHNGLLHSFSSRSFQLPLFCIAYTARRARYGDFTDRLLRRQINSYARYRQDDDTC